MATRVLNEGQPVAEDWLNVLRAGGSQKPSCDDGRNRHHDRQAVTQTISYIGELIDEVEKLTEEIEAQ